MTATPANLVEPRLYKGLRDLSPELALARESLMTAIRGVYERYGFAPLVTPAIEYLDVLKGAGAGEEATRQLFLCRGPEDDAIALRFDHTVALARVVAQMKRSDQLTLPFKRHASGPVWRADKPDPGRYREFVQFDIDAVGVASELADVEVMCAMGDALSACGAGPTRMMFSSRRILDLLLRFAGVPETLELVHADGRKELRTASDVFRVLDKLEKVGKENVRLELMGGYVDKSGAKVPGLMLSAETTARIESFLAISPGRDATILALRSLFSNVEGASAEIDVLARMSDHLGARGFGEDRVVLDLSIARGLAYYTGPVFETILTDLPRFGSVCSGGRYDDLVMRFLGEPIPATGASIGVDRLLAALVELGRLKLRRSASDVLIAVLDQALMSDYIAMANELRQSGLNTDLYLGTAGLGKQMKYGDRLGIPLVVLQGGDEKARGTVTIKEMESGRVQATRVDDRKAWLSARPGQLEVPRSDLSIALHRLLGKSSAS